MQFLDTEGVKVLWNATVKKVSDETQARTKSVSDEAAARKASDDRIEKIVIDQHSFAELTASPNLIEKGATTATPITLTYGYKYADKYVAPNSISLTTGGGKNIAVTAANKLQSVSDSVTGTSQTYTLSVTYSGVSKTKTALVDAFYPIYLRSSEISAPGTDKDSFVFGGTKQTIRRTAVGTYTGTATSGLYVWICTPQMKIAKVTSGGFDVPMQAYVEVATSKGTYYCYRTTNKLAAGSFTFVVS